MLFGRIVKATATTVAAAGLLLSAAAVPAQADEAGATAHVAKLSENAVALLTDRQIDANDKAAALHKLFVEGFDIRTLSRAVLGRHWRKADDAQRAAYVQAFEAYVVKTYVRRLSQLDDVSVKIKGARELNEKDSLVSTRFAGPNGQPLNIDWRVRTRDGEAKIIDVIVEGVSMAVTQRAEFSALIRSHGGKLDMLIAALEKKAAA